MADAKQLPLDTRERVTDDQQASIVISIGSPCSDAGRDSQQQESRIKCRDTLSKGWSVERRVFAFAETRHVSPNASDDERVTREWLGNSLP